MKTFWPCVTADLATLGKIISGGMPGAAVVGRADLFEAMDFRRAVADGEEKVFHMGTFNASPATCAAGIAALRLVAGTDACQQAIRYGDGLMDDLNDLFRIGQCFNQVQALPVQRLTNHRTANIS